MSPPPADGMIGSKTAKALVLALWLIIVGGCGLYSALRIAGGNAFVSDIMALMPGAGAGTEESTAGRPQLAQNTRLQKNFLVLVANPQDRQGTALAVELRQALARQPGIRVEQNFSATLAAITGFFQPYRHQLLSRASREKLQKLTAEELAQEALAALYSPAPGFRPYSLQDDPFNLAGSWYQGLFPQAGRMEPGEIPAVRDGDDTWYLVRATLDASPFDLTSQQAVDQVVEGFQSSHPQARLLVSGFVFHAAEATTAARREIATVGNGSLLGIVLLVLAVFRSGKSLLAIGLTLVTSTVIALAASLAVFGSVHLITLAFGSTLLGLAVDYCMHFLVKCHRVGHSLLAGRLIAKGLIISAGSTILAFVVQLGSPFPGLQQFAVFVASGLAAACLAVAVLAFCYKPPQAPPQGPNRFFERTLAPLYQRLAKRNGLFLPVLVLVAATAVVVLARSEFSDDIRLLNTSSPRLIDSEIRVNQLLGGMDTQRFWTVAGDNQQQVLERTEQMLATLPPQAQVMTASQLVPSLQQQQRDHQLVMAKLYGPGAALEQLCAALNSDCQVWKDQDYRFRTGLDLQAIPPQVAESFPVLSMVDGHHGIILPFLGKDFGAAELPHITPTAGVLFVDKVSELSATLAAFRLEVTELLVLLLLAFTLLCLWLYRRQAVVVVTPVLVSLAVALASSAGNGITLFHLLALLLVAGIAIDAGIFYLELGLNGDTWLASTLATLTSVLAFGLLSLSQFPVLHQFGTVVSAGLLCAWLVTPVLYLAGQSTTSIPMKARK